MSNIFSSSGGLGYPQHFPETSIDFLNNRSIPLEYNFTRNSSGAYVGADGYIKTAATNEPRFDYDPITGEFKGLLVEESRTNTIQTSSNFNIPDTSPNSINYNSIGSYFNATYTKILNSGPAPDNTNTALLTITTDINTENNKIEFGSVGMSPGTYSHSFFYKNSNVLDRSITGFLYGNSTTSDEGIAVSFSVDSSGIPSNSSLRTILYPNGWTRLIYIQTSNVTRTQGRLFEIQLKTNKIGSQMLFWGFQNESGLFPTSYIPTSGSAVTRQPDQLILNKPFNSLGTFFVESNQTRGTTLSADNGTSNILMSSTGKEALYYNTNRTLRMPSDSTPSLINTTTPQDLNRVSLGFNRLTNSSYINGYLKKFMYYGSPITEDNLRSLTGNTLDTYRYNNDGIVTNGLVLNLDAAYYDGGTTWTDLSGLSNNGTLVNGVGYDSANGGSLSFDGVDDYINFGDIFNDVFAGVDKKFAISSWVNYNTLKPTGNVILSKSGDITFDENERQIYLSVRNPSNDYGSFELEFLTYFNPAGAPFQPGSNYAGYRTVNANIQTNQYYNFVVSYDGSIDDSGRYSLFVNGIQYNVTPTITAGGLENIQPGNARMSIGAVIGVKDENSPYGLLDGKIPQVSVYNRVLTASEVQQNFNTLRGRFGI
jgi:hypothetical protein